MLRSPCASLFVAALLAPLVLTSCRVTSRTVTQSQQAKEYERLEIIYRAHPATGPLFSSPPAGVIQASARVDSEAHPFQTMTWSKTELRIECPHPDGRTDVALVTLHFRPVECGHECERKSWEQRREERADTRQTRRTTFRQRWFYESSVPVENETVKELELPKSELDAILIELNTHGFFVDQGHVPDSEADLEVRLNRRWTSHPWSYEPSLDALTTRVYQEGTSRTADAAVPPGPRFNPLTWVRPTARSK